MKRLFALLLCLLLLTGCGQDGDEQRELWLVMEDTDDAMGQQIEVVVERFRELHPDVDVRLDVLPGGEETRAGYLQRIRSEVMSGGGPDVYILPTAPVAPPAGEESSTPYLEPLYSDVVQQMYNGIFTDISEYYNADTDLGKEALVTAVMDAGVMDGCRYVLPLRYDFDVLLVNVDAVEELGIDMDVFEGGIDELYDLALEREDELIAHAVNVKPSHCLLADFIDYQKGNVLLDTQEVAELMTVSREVTVLENAESRTEEGHWIGGRWVVFEDAYEGYYCDISSYITRGKSERIFTNAGYLLYRMELSDCIQAAAAIKQSGGNIAMCPVRAADGSLNAEITWYGAVGAGCDEPELAYELLRIFLSEEIQWEQYWPRNAGLGTVEEKVAEGHIVRSVGSAEPFYENIRKRLQAAQDSDIKMKFYQYVSKREKFLVETFSIDDSDVPILSVQIDEARFPVVTAEGEVFSKYLTRFEAGEDALSLAEEMKEELKWLLAEG